MNGSDFFAIILIIGVIIFGARTIIAQAEAVPLFITPDIMRLAFMGLLITVIAVGAYLSLKELT